MVGTPGDPDGGQSQWCLWTYLPPLRGGGGDHQHPHGDRTLGDVRVLPGVARGAESRRLQGQQFPCPPKTLLRPRQPPPSRQPVQGLQKQKTNTCPFIMQPPGDPSGTFLSWSPRPCPRNPTVAHVSVSLVLCASVQGSRSREGDLVKKPGCKFWNRESGGCRGAGFPVPPAVCFLR